jgi:hypothetical protein
MIYVASSWRNAEHGNVLDCLDQWALEYYDFKGEKGFHWSEVMPGYQESGVTSQMLITALEHERAKEGFKRDMDALLAASSLLLVLPCGRSAHLELGWAVGSGLSTCVYFPYSYRQDIEPELMYKMCGLVTDDIDLCMRTMNDYERYTNGSG